MEVGKTLVFCARTCSYRTWGRLGSEFSVELIHFLFDLDGSKCSGGLSRACPGAGKWFGSDWHCVSGDIQCETSCREHEAKCMANGFFLCSWFLSGLLDSVVQKNHRTCVQYGQVLPTSTGQKDLFWKSWGGMFVEGELWAKDTSKKVRVNIEFSRISKTTWAFFLGQNVRAWACWG
jgi:hypothetical protein